MNGKSLFGIIVGLVAFVWLCTAVSANKWKGRAVLYYGVTCPHCRNVEEFIKAGNIEAVLKIDRREVYENKANLKDLISVAGRCRISEKSVSVPFLWDGSQCLEGENVIKEYFSKRAKG